MSTQQIIGSDIYGRPIYAQQPMMPTPSMYQPQQTALQIAKVHGQKGAEDYPLQANSEILMLDLDEPKVWLKKTDAAGYAVQVQSYSIVMPEDPQQVALSSIEQRISRLEGIINGQSDTQRSNKQQSNNGRKE